MNADKTGMGIGLSRGWIHRLERHSRLGAICVHLRLSADPKLFAGLTRLLLAFGLLLPPRAQALEEVPFVTTPDNVTLAMLELARVGPSDYVIDLGSGDGRIVIVAAKRFGARGLGVEIVPGLVQRSRENALAAGVAQRVEFLEQDLFKTELARATVITMYLLPDVNLELRPKILALQPGTRIVSHDWDMGDWMPDQTITLAVPEKAVGLEKSSKVHLWIVPARVNGGWCGTGRARGTTLDIEQSFQQFHVTLERGTLRQEFDGRIEGASAKSVDEALVLDADTAGLHVRAARKEFTPLRNASFVRRSGERCAR
jgi:SAM-dependent methyltransferase